MPVTDSIADLLTRIRNAQAIRRPACAVPWSRMKQELCELLVREGYLAEVRREGEGKAAELRMTFAPQKKLELRRMSTPGRRWYKKARELRPVLQGYGIAILTTNQGLITDREARIKKIGGEVLCTIS